MHIMEKSGRECSPTGKHLNQYGNEIDKIVDIYPLVRSVKFSTDRTDAISGNPKELNGGPLRSTGIPIDWLSDIPCAAAQPQTMFETLLDGVFPFIKSLGGNGGGKVCAIRDSQTNNGV